MLKGLIFGLGSAALVSVVSVGCSSSETSTPDPEPTAGETTGGGSTAGASTAGATTAGASTAGSTGGAPAKASAAITEEPCTEEGAICTKYSVPGDMTGTPARIFVAFYKSLPPMGPPDVFGSELKEGVNLKAGAGFSLKQTGITGLAGQTLHVYTVIYMPGGGQFQPKPGVDYVAHTKEPVTFDGKAKTIEGLTFELAK